MTRENRILRKLYELTGQKSGIVVCGESGEVMVCNWTKDADLPHVFSTEIIGSGERLYLREVRHVDDVAAEIDTGRIIYDINGDAGKLSGTSATAHVVVTFERGTEVCVVYTPQGWN